MDRIAEPAQRLWKLGASVLVSVVLIALLLSAAGIYSLMAFTVSQRTREIGIRAALGARPSRIAMAIFSRAFVQLGLGAAAGSVAFGLAMGTRTVQAAGILAALAALMMGVGLLACAGPMRRALRIQPTEAMKDAG